LADRPLHILHHISQHPSDGVYGRLVTNFVQKEQAEIEKREAELERQLAQRFLTQNHEAHIRSLTEKISIGLDNLDFTGKQELLRLLVEKVVYNGQSIEILTIIPLGEQLHPIHREGLRG